MLVHIINAMATNTAMGSPVAGTNAFMTLMPASPDHCFCVYDAGGSSTPQGVECPWYEYRFEVRTRSTQALATLAIMDAIIAVFDHKQNTTMNNDMTFHFARPDGHQSILEYDKRNRAICVCRFVMQLPRATEQYSA